MSLLKANSKITSETDFLEGQVLLFNKPLGWSSFDVVKKVRGIIKSVKKIKKIKVGIVWKGSSHFVDDKYRSLKLENFYRQIDLSKDVQFFSLQKELNQFDSQAIF